MSTVDICSFNCLNHCGALVSASYPGFAYAIAGTRTEDLVILASLEDLDKDRCVPAYNFAIIYVGLGDFDKSFEWFAQARKERSGLLPFRSLTACAAIRGFRIC